MINEKVSEIESQAEKEATSADLDDELDDDLNNFGNVFQEVQFIHVLTFTRSNSAYTPGWQKEQKQPYRGSVQREEREKQDLCSHPEGD